jgi:signal transduction histidine kinase/ligand-binding sensor domain-containing protein
MQPRSTLASRFFLRAKHCSSRVLAVCVFAQLLLVFPGHAQQTPSPTSELPLARYTHQVWNSSSGLPQDTVRQFLETHDGFLWMATDGGLVRFDGIDFSIYDRRNTPAMQSDLVNALFEDKGGSLWVGTSNGLLRLGAGQFTRYTTQQGLPSDTVSSIYPDRDGVPCADTAAGSACFTPAGFTAMHDPATKPASPPVSWIATPEGLLHQENGRSLLVPMPEGFTGSDVLTVYTDREGNIWVGSENAGAAILRRPTFNTIGRREGLAADQVRSLFQDATGDLWFGTSAGLTRLHEGQFSDFTVAQALASNEVIALAGAGAEDLWVGTPDGLSHLQHDRINTLTASDGLPDDDIRSLLEARDHTLWIGTTHGLAQLKPGSGTPSIRTWTTADGLPSNVIGSLLEDADGSLWVGTRGGLAQLRDGSIRSITGGFQSTIITALGRDVGGTLWIGTGGGGVYTLEPNQALHRMGPGILPDTVYGILDDGHGQIWMSSADGIYRFDRSKSVATRFDVSDGLRINDCSSGGHPEAIRSSDRRLLFATGKGVSMVDPAELPVHPQPPPVALEGVLIDDAAAPINASIRVPAGHERIALHYAGLSFTAPSKVRYRYRLEPFDQGWIDAGSRRTAFYTNIPPGKYRFLVLASSDGSTWSASAAEVGLVIAPHYYQTWWFYSLLGALVGLFAWQLYLYRVRQVELRFHAVLAERGRIAREIHDTLAQDIVAISVQLDLISRLMTLSIDKAREQLIATRELVRKSLAEARSSIWDLRSQSSASTDLPARLREVTRQVVGDAPLKLSLEITGTYRAAKPELEDELLRIAQEAVTNAVRHGGPQTIDVSLSYDARGVSLRVHDDGRGFVVDGRSGPPGHYGIRGMHERAHRAQAQLTVDSAPGAGTTVVAEARIP